VNLEGRYILEAGLNHIESDFGKWLPLCGANLDRDEVNRVPYETSDQGWEQSHTVFCMACTQVKNRRAVEGNGGALS
jgi:hypothetical protein